MAMILDHLVPTMQPYETDPLVGQVIDSYRERLTHFAGHRQRVQLIDLLNSGHWGRVFPNDVNEADLPMVENLFRMVIEDGGDLFGEIEPSTSVPWADEDEKKQAEEREQCLVAYDNLSPMLANTAFSGMDMIAAGFSGILTWPEFGKPIGKRFPIHTRLDPRNTLPEPGSGPTRPSDSVMVSTLMSSAELGRRFPEPMAQMYAMLDAMTRRRDHGVPIIGEVEARPKKFLVISFYGREWVCDVALHDPEGRGEGSCAVLLAKCYNETDLCPVQIAYRPTWSREPLGQLDDVRGIVQTENRFFKIIQAYFVRMVYGGKLAWQVANPEARGPDVTYMALGPDAKMDPVTPDNMSYQVWPIQDRLSKSARASAMYPESRGGDVDLNKASAAYLSRAQGSLRTAVAAIQKQYAIAKRRANEVAFAQDEAWCNAKKEITGIARGRRFSMTYTPKDTIKGDYANIVRYGTSSGLDKPTDTVMRIEKLQAGGMSLQKFLEDDPDTDDVTVAIAQINEELITKGLMATLAAPEGDLEEKAIAFTAFKKNRDVSDVALEIIELRKTKAQQAQGPIPGLSELGGSTAPGAVPPSGAPGVPAPQNIGPLPDMNTVRKLARQGR